jgi:hypothetical protein
LKASEVNKLSLLTELKSSYLNYLGDKDYIKKSQHLAKLFVKSQNQQEFYKIQTTKAFSDNEKINLYEKLKLQEPLNSLVYIELIRLKLKLNQCKEVITLAEEIIYEYIFNADMLLYKEMGKVCLDQPHISFWQKSWVNYLKYAEPTTQRDFSWFKKLSDFFEVKNSQPRIDLSLWLTFIKNCNDSKPQLGYCFVEDMIKKSIELGPKEK